jgi:hypothetical protein
MKRAFPIYHIREYPFISVSESGFQCAAGGR